MAERNPLVLTDIGGGGGKLEELPATDTLPQAATVATLADAAASSILPAAGTLTPLAALLQVVRNNLRWLLARFDASGILSVAFGGTGNGLGTSVGVTVTDSRAVASTPAQIETKRVSAAFKQTAVMDSPPVTSTQSLYSHIVRVAGWDEGGSGGWPTELSIGPGGIAFRYGTSATTWSPWSQLHRKGSAIDIADGTVAAPGMSFAAEPSTGFRRSATGGVRYVSTGVDAYEFDSSNLTAFANRGFVATGNSGRVAMLGSSGVEYAPGSTSGSWARGFVIRSIDLTTFIAGSGFLGAGETLTRWAVGFNSGWWTTYAFAVGPADAAFAVPTRWLNGSAAAPSVSFTNASSSGLFHAGGGGIGLSIGGAQKVIFGTTAILIGSGVSSTPQAGIDSALQIRGPSMTAGSVGITNSDASGGRGGALFLGKDRAGGVIAAGDYISEVYHTAHNGTSHAAVAFDRVIASGVSGGAISVRAESTINGVTVETTTATSKSLGVPLRLASYTLSTLPSAAALDGHLIEVSNATGGAKVCRSNGSAWQLLNTATTVS